MKYFLLVYDRLTGDLHSCDDFDSSREAFGRRLELEREYPDHERIEIVVLAAASRDELRKTHARYFRDASQLASRLVSEDQESSVRQAKRRDVRKARPRTAAA